MKKALLSLLLLFTSAQAQEAADKVEITGAFGLILGDIFNVKLALAEEGRLTSGKMFAIYPPKKAGGFSDYFILITPVTNRISQIGAARYFEDKSQCLGELHVFKEYLIRKYGKLKKLELRYIYAAFIYKSGNRSIYLACQGEPDNVTLIVLYEDSSLEALGKKEHAKSELKK